MGVGARWLTKRWPPASFAALVNRTLDAFGGTAVFDTTGWRSGSNLFSCMEQIRTITGRGNPEEGVVAGIPLRLVLRPYRTSHNGQPSTQYGVSLQLRAELYNLFNHANYGSYTTQQSNAAYGRPAFNSNVAYQPRIVQLGFRLAF